MEKSMTTKEAGMEQNLTAKVSCFAKAYHYRNNEKWVFADTLAEKILGTDYDVIATHMSSGILFFCPDFEGTKEEALRWIVDNQLSPSVLGRSAFCERKLLNEIAFGCKQYLIFGAGYDTFAYRNDFSDIRVFELDRAEVLADKKGRLTAEEIDISRVSYISCDFEKEKWGEKLLASTYRTEKKAFCSMLGLSYYMSKFDFEKLLQQMVEIFPVGSAVVFDYPMEVAGVEVGKNRELAMAAGEAMKASYTYEELEKMLESCGLLIYEHLDEEEMTKQYFETYNSCYSERKIYAPKGVGYCMAVKR